jgi:hypothetical protein
MHGEGRSREPASRPSLVLTTSTEALGEGRAGDVAVFVCDGEACFFFLFLFSWLRVPLGCVPVGALFPVKKKNLLLL